MVKFHEMDSLLKCICSKTCFFLHVIPCTFRGNLCTVVNGHLNRQTSYIIFKFLTVADISPHCCRHSPTVADISPPQLRTFSPLLWTSPLLQTHSLQTLFWDICDHDQLQSFGIQSCCMMSTYHITKYIQLIRNIFFRLCNKVSPTFADRDQSKSISWDLTL